jgi:murein DD-endopeptidase MepM/ murein hydrolase activator NlpD
MASLVRTRTLAAQYTYVFPVQPAIYAGFSEGGHSYATDIFAPMTEVCCRFVAPTSGYIEAVSYDDLYDPDVDDPELRGGIFVAMVGDDGVRYYGAHLSRVADGIWVNLEVEAGQTLGWVGMTGSARDTLPHVHFGISHPTDPNDWETRRGEINPYPYLVLWLEGQNVTPDLGDLRLTPTVTPTP